MRGSKGGFWDRLIARMRRRKLLKKQKKQLEDEQNNQIIIQKNFKRKKEEQVLYILNINNNYEQKIQKRKYKMIKKGISSKIVTIPKTTEKNEKNVIINNTENIIKKKRKKINVGFFPKNDSKNISILKNKEVPKTEKNIHPKSISDNNKKYNKLEEKSTKLIEELNKLIDDNRNKINKISLQIVELKNELNQATIIKKVEEIEQKLIELKRKLIELMENYKNIKDGSFNNIKNEKINIIIEEIKKIDSNFDFNKIVDTISPNLDYYNDLSNNTVNTVSMIYSSSYKKDIINYKNNEEHNFNIELKDFSEINNKLSKELDKHKNIIKEFNMLINKISPKKIVDVQNDFLSTMLHNTGCLIGAFLSIPFLKKTKNVPLFAFGLFTINNSIRNMRKVTTNEVINYIPSEDYANQIIKYKNSFGFIDYMISNSLYQISSLKEEYKINFSSFHNYEEFNKNLEKIEAMESKILKQANEIKELKNKYGKTLDKNYEKVLSIKNSKK